jgi:hypothetical protein
MLLQAAYIGLTPSNCTGTMTQGCVPSSAAPGIQGVAGGIPGATEAVGQRGLQRSLCCCQALAAVAVPAAEPASSALLSTPCSGQCGVLELLQHMKCTSCWVVWQPWPAALGQKQRHTRAAQLFSGQSPAVTSRATMKPRAATRQRLRAAHCCLGLMILLAPATT